MQQLNVLTSNKLGTNFWELRTGLFGSIQEHPLQISDFEQLFDSDAESILIDFYFTHLSETEEIAFIASIESKIKMRDSKLTLFVLSPRYANEEIHEDNLTNTLIIKHNFSSQFLKLLFNTGRTISIQNQAS